MTKMQDPDHRPITQSVETPESTREDYQPSLESPTISIEDERQRLQRENISLAAADLGGSQSVGKEAHASFDTQAEVEDFKITPNEISFIPSVENLNVLSEHGSTKIKAETSLVPGSVSAKADFTRTIGNPSTWKLETDSLPVDLKLEGQGASGASFSTQVNWNRVGEIVVHHISNDKVRAFAKKVGVKTEDKIEESLKSELEIKSERTHTAGLELAESEIPERIELSDTLRGGISNNEFVTKTEEGFDFSASPNLSFNNPSVDLEISYGKNIFNVEVQVESSLKDPIALEEATLGIEVSEDGQFILRAKDIADDDPKFSAGVFIPLD